MLNTKNGVDNLTGRLISDIVLQVLSYVAQLEREQIRKRQAEGIREAKRKGVRLGRHPFDIPKEFYELEKAYRKGELSLRQGASKLGVSKSTFHNWIKKHKKIVQ